jgi:hypothetical protein
VAQYEDDDDMALSDGESPTESPDSQQSSGALAVQDKPVLLPKRSAEEAQLVLRRMAMIRQMQSERNNGIIDTGKVQPQKVMTVSDARKDDIEKTARWIIENPDKESAVLKKSAGHPKFGFLFDRHTSEGLYFIEIKCQVKREKAELESHSKKIAASEGGDDPNPIKSSEMPEMHQSSKSKEPTQDASGPSDKQARQGEGYFGGSASPAGSTATGDDSEHDEHLDDGASLASSSSTLPPAAEMHPLAHLWSSAPSDALELKILSALDEKVDEKAASHSIRGATVAAPPARFQMVLKNAPGGVAQSSDRTADKDLKWSHKDKPPPTPPAGWTVKWSERKNRWFWYHSETKKSDWAPPREKTIKRKATTSSAAGHASKSRSLTSSESQAAAADSKIPSEPKMGTWAPIES